MFSSSNKNELTTPLLGTEQQEEQYDPTIHSDSEDDEDDFDDDESSETGCTMTCTFHADDHDDETVRSCIFDNWVIWFVLPLLLFLQFGMAFTVDERQHGSTRALDHQIIQLDWTTVNYSIVLFMVASYLYRRAINRQGFDSVVIQLLPEIIMDIVLGLVLFHYVVYGFLCMVSATCLMAVYSAISSCRLFVSYESDDEDDDTKKEPTTRKYSGDDIKLLIV